MEKWYDHKLDKYLPLKSAVKCRGWEVDIYAIEVGGIVQDLCCVLCRAQVSTTPKQQQQQKKTLENCEKIVNGINSLFVSGWPETMQSGNVFVLNSPLNNTTSPESIPKDKSKSNLSNSPTPSELPFFKH